MTKDYILYHGTKAENVNSIIENNFFVTEKDSQYLGDGVYFYDECDLAKGWATKYGKNSTNWAVIECVVKVDEKEVFDLCQQEAKNIFKEFVSEFYQKIKNNRKRKAGDYTQQLIYLRCAIMNLFATEHNLSLVIACVNKKLNALTIILNSLGIESYQERIYVVKKPSIIEERKLINIRW